MKFKLPLATLAAALLPISAYASDLPNRKVPPPALQSHAHNWTGFYVGGSVGISNTNSSGSLDIVNTPGFALYSNDDIGPLSAFGTPNFESSRFSLGYGAKAGYLYQTGKFVVGVEGDLYHVGLEQRSSASGNPFTTWNNSIAAFQSHLTQGSIAVLKTRIGYDLDNALIYMTGGYAWGNVKFYQSYIGMSWSGNGSESQSSSVSETKSGWVIGAGLDYALTQNWIISAEYLHVDLGSVYTSGLVTTGNSNTASMNFTVPVTENIFTTSLKYKF